MLGLGWLDESNPLPSPATSSVLEETKTTHLLLRGAGCPAPTTPVGLTDLRGCDPKYLQIFECPFGLVRALARLIGLCRFEFLQIQYRAFIDSAGLEAILRSRALCEEHRCGFCLIPGVRNVARLYELDGLVDKLPWAPPGLWKDCAPAYEPREALRLVSARG
jgi:hypothetical protein